MISRVGVIVWIISLSALVPLLQAEQRVPPELLVLASQPSVYPVLTFGDFELTYPKVVNIDDAQLMKDVAAERAVGKIQGERTDAQHAWVLLATNTEKYLSCSAETLSASLKDAPYSGGTAFAVSREGILITNAHVLQDPDANSLPDLVAVSSLMDSVISPVVMRLAEAIGGGPIEVDRPAVVSRMTEWWGKHSHATGKFRQAKLVLKYDRPDTKFNLGKLASFLSAPRAITVPMEILCIGEPAPGKDVAVLRAIMQSNDRERLKAIGARDDEIDQIIKAGQEDKLICLPLGDSSEVLPGAKVQAMGFPASAYLDDWMTLAATCRVSTRDGQVGQTKPVRGGYDMIEMTAGIDHGDSGGPVLDSNGRVIGINVGGGPNNAATLAVPINVAKEFLAKAGINPDPGKLSERWIEAVKAFGAGELSRAQELLRLVERNQGSEMVLMALPNPLDLQPPAALGRQNDLFITEDLINPYVRELQKRIAVKQR